MSSTGPGPRKGTSGWAAGQGSTTQTGLGTSTVGQIATSKIADNLTEVVKPIASSPKAFKFPLENVSAGNFWTKLTINSWVPVRAKGEPEVKSTHGLQQFHLADIWLPMPLTLNTAYNQNFSEVEDMMVNRGLDQSGGTWESMLGGHGAAIAATAGNELYKTASALAGFNSSGKMALGSIANQNMGLTYDGAALRAHSFSWRLTPKNEGEQHAIEQIVFALKKFSAPIVKGKLGGEVNMATSAKEGEEAVKQADAMTIASEQTGASLDQLKAGVASMSASLRNIGRLGIPPTVNAQFWFNGSPNAHLFQVKDSFITSVEVNYTPTGTWNAYKDGAPIETQITIGFKENAIVTAGDITDSGGY